MKINSSSPFKKCPRCKEKCFVHEKACHECGLVFERLNYTSNKTAKKLIWKRRRRETIMTSDWPYDAKKSTALWLCGLLGFTGAHNFYLGRFWKAFVCLFGIVLSIIMVILNDTVIYGTSAYEILRWIVLIPGSCCLIFWISDFITIFFERYKISAAIDENLINLKSQVLDDKIPKNVSNEKIEENIKKNVIKNIKNKKNKRK